MSRREHAPAVPPTLSARGVQPAAGWVDRVEQIDLEAMMRQLSGRLDPAGQSSFAADQRAAREQVCALAKALWEDEHYRPLVEWLLDITVRRPISVWGLGATKAEYVDRREGANSVVWQLLQAVAEGRGEHLPIREGQPE